MKVVPLYPDQYPQTIPPEKQEELVEPRGIIRNIHYPTLDVYLPEPSKPTGQAVVVCPGGGYWVLAADHEGKQIAEMLNTWGVAAFVLKYRLPPDYPHPVPMNDAQRALRVVRSCAASWNVDPTRIGIMGFSAGGHLASTVATHFDLGKPDALDAVDRMSCRPDFVILGYPVVCFAADYCHSGSRVQLIGKDLPEDLKRELSNDLQVTDQSPPAFLFHSQDDKGVDPRNSIDYFLACKAQGVPAELHVFPTGGHGYGVGAPGTAESQWPGLLKRWLEGVGKSSCR